MANELALHAVVEKAGASRKSRGGKGYKVVFSYPRSYLPVIDELIDSGLDLFWNEEAIASSASIKSVSVKPRKNLDPLYLMTLELDGSDSSLANLNDLVDTAGDLRMVITQMAMNLP